MRLPHHTLTHEPWAIALFIVGIVIIIALLIWFIHRRTVASDGLTTKERKELPNEQKEILSMLRQHGGPMMQTGLVDIMPYDLDDAVEILKEMESRGLIHRQWKSEKGTYEIIVAS
jgi:uncharacterized membrane protein